MQQYPISLAPGAQAEFQIAGDYVRVVELAAAPADAGAYIRVRNDLAHDFVLIGNASMRLAREAKRWAFHNETASTLTATVLIGSGEYHDNNMAATISTTDAALQATQAGQAFAGTTYVAMPASTYGQHSILNPTGSGKIVVIDRLRWDPPAASSALQVRLGSGITPQGTLQAGALNNKLLAAANGVAKLYEGYGTTGAWLSGQGSLKWGLTKVPTSSPSWGMLDVIGSTHPLVLAAGECLMLYVPSNSGDAKALWDWRELSA